MTALPKPQPVPVDLSTAAAAQAALRTFWRLAEAWKLDIAEQTTLLGVDIDADQLRWIREIRFQVDRVIGRSDLSAHREHSVARCDERSNRREHCTHRYRERMTRRQQSTSVGGHNNRRVEALRQTPELGGSPDRPTTREYDRTLRGS